VPVLICWLVDWFISDCLFISMPVFDCFSVCELDVLWLIVCGWFNVEIVVDFFIGEIMVKIYVVWVFMKLGL